MNTLPSLCWGMGEEGTPPVPPPLPPTSPALLWGGSWAKHPRKHRMRVEILAPHSSSAAPKGSAPQLRKVINHKNTAPDFQGLRAQPGCILSISVLGAAVSTLVSPTPATSPRLVRSLPGCTNGYLGGGRGLGLQLGRRGRRSLQAGRHFPLGAEAPESCRQTRDLIKS